MRIVTMAGCCNEANRFRFRWLQFLSRYTLVMLIFDVLAPLDRCDGESRTAHTALLDYWNAGAGRSLRSLISKYRSQSEDESCTVRPPTNRFQTISIWSSENRWQERIDAALSLQQEAEEKLKADALKSEAVKWAKRRLDVKEKDWNQAEALRELTDRLLVEGPKFLKTTRRFVPGSRGSPDKEIITVAMDTKLMINGLIAASKLQRLAADMETEHTLSENTTPEDIEEIRKKRWESIKDAVADALPEDDEEEDSGDVESE